jgi:hypothetical protein
MMLIMAGRNFPTVAYSLALAAGNPVVVAAAAAAATHTVTITSVAFSLGLLSCAGKHAMPDSVAITLAHPANILLQPPW